MSQHRKDILKSAEHKVAKGQLLDPLEAAEFARHEKVNQLRRERNNARARNDKDTITMIDLRLARLGYRIRATGPCSQVVEFIPDWRPS